MSFQINIKITFIVLLFASIFSVFGQSKNSKFTVVLDAGHGGKDPGNSYHGFVEKEIALKTTLKVGEILEKERDFEVVYTRKTDTFIELNNRPKVANKAKADLFVSIHCNSVKNHEPSGTETFVMGLSRTDMNLEVAKSENSVILLEDNYNKTYKGFDPKKPESMIGRVIVQEENLNSSISLASLIQDNFTFNLNRKSRGVKQQPLWVLDAAVMPGVLIELGFLSNKEEGEFLNSDEGQTKMARQIAQAIIRYKKEYYNEALGNEKPVVEDKRKKEEIIQSNEKEVSVIENTANSQGLYRVQLFVTSKKRNANSSDFKGLKNISFTFENNLYKYYYGNTSNADEVKKMCQEAKDVGFTDAFIVTFAEGKI
jgi:N-acetylmuramoyl-L-alanine amidase